jgi:hypothetical protein
MPNERQAPPWCVWKVFEGSGVRLAMGSHGVSTIRPAVPALTARYAACASSRAKRCVITGGWKLPSSKPGRSASSIRAEATRSRFITFERPRLAPQARDRHRELFRMRAVAREAGIAARAPDLRAEPFGRPLDHHARIVPSGRAGQRRLTHPAFDVLHVAGIDRRGHYFHDGLARARDQAGQILGGETLGSPCCLNRRAFMTCRSLRLARVRFDSPGCVVCPAPASVIRRLDSIDPPA